MGRGRCDQVKREPCRVSFKCSKAGTHGFHKSEGRVVPHPQSPYRTGWLQVRPPAWGGVLNVSHLQRWASKQHLKGRYSSWSSILSPAGLPVRTPTQWCPLFSPARRGGSRCISSPEPGAPHTACGSAPYATSSPSVGAAARPALATLPLALTRPNSTHAFAHPRHICRLAWPQPGCCSLEASMGRCGPTR